MRSFMAAALMGVSATSAFSISDYIMAAGGTPASAPSFGKSQDSTAATSEDATATTEPCAQVSSFLSKAAKPFVNAELAYDCLRSVPLDVEGGLLQLDGLDFMVSFQSTTAYLKNPPAGYLYPPVDIEGGIAQLKANLQNSVYSNEYDFQLAIYTLISRAYDGHFNYIPDIVNVFGFLRDNSIFSLSADGVALPQLWLGGPSYNVTDFGSSSGAMVPIAKINHVDAEAWLNEYASQNGGNQDPDANYNAIFPVIPTLSMTGAGQFTGSSYYQGPHTTLTFVDGKTFQVNHSAATDLDFTGVKDGKTFFKKFCTGQRQEQQSSKKARSVDSDDTPETPFKPVKPGTKFPAPLQFPAPVVANKKQPVAGYFPESENPDLAVLSITSFTPDEGDDVAFSDTIRTFLATAQQAGKKKLVIDLRGNGGGDVVLAYDTFVQLFPKIYPYGGTNFRATPLVHDVGAVVSEFFRNVTEATATNADCGNNYVLPLFDYRVTVDANGQPFDSWDEFFGPHEYHGDNFTSIDRYDLENRFSTFCTPVSNYQSLRNITPQVFDPEDVVIVQDGACASTCAVFSEFMKTQAGIKQIAFGGRARNGPMQGVGGVKGANVYGLDLLVSSLYEAITKEATSSERAYLNQTYGGLTAGADQALTRAAANSEGSEARVNARNNIRYGDETVTPLQFVYEAADCRLFYTPNQIFEQELVWKAAYNVRWGNGQCVPGSTNQPSSLSGPVYPANGTATPTTSGPQWGVTGTPSGHPSPYSNGTGIWSSTITSASSTTWGSTHVPSSTSSTSSTASPSSTIISSTNGAMNRVSLGWGFTLVSTIASMLWLL